MSNQIFIPLLMTLIAGLATVVGGFFTFAIKRDNLKALSVGLGFSAGVMIYLSFTEIITGASELLSKFFPHNYPWMVLGGFIFGIIVAILIDFFIPDHIENDLFTASEGDCQEGEFHCDHHHRIKRAGLLTAIAICIHNFPEGLATFLVSTQDITLGLSVAVAIAIHNIPEGIAVALPIYHVTGKKRYALWYSFLAGISEPIGAIIGICLINALMPQMFVGFLFAAVAGIMIYISFDTLLPLSKEYGNWHLTMWGIMAGIIFIWAGLILLH